MDKIIKKLEGIDILSIPNQGMINNLQKDNNILGYHALTVILLNDILEELKELNGKKEKSESVVEKKVEGLKETVEEKVEEVQEEEKQVKKSAKK